MYRLVRQLKFLLQLTKVRGFLIPVQAGYRQLNFLLPISRVKRAAINFLLLVTRVRGQQLISFGQLFPSSSRLFLAELCQHCFTLSVLSLTPSSLPPSLLSALLPSLQLHIPSIFSFAPWRWRFTKQLVHTSYIIYRVQLLLLRRSRSQPLLITISVYSVGQSHDVISIDQNQVHDIGFIYRLLRRQKSHIGIPT